MRSGVPGLALALLLSAGVARAEPLGLTWDAPEGCPEQSSVALAAERLAGGAARSLAAEAQVRHTAPEWVLVLSIEGGSRTLRGTSCSEVTNAAVVILALAMNPDATVAERAEPEPSEKRSSSANEREGPPPVVPAPVVATDDDAPGGARPSNDALAFGAAFRVLGVAGVLPEPSLGASAALRLGSSNWFGELSIAGLLPRSAAASDSSESGGNFGWQTLELSGALAWWKRSPFFVRAGFELGRLVGEGYGVDHADSGQALWLAPVLGVLARPLGGRSLGLEAELVASAALFQPRFGLNSDAEIYRPGVAGLRAALGLGWH